MHTYIGLDFGTDSVRAILVDASGALLSSSVAAYSRWGDGRYCAPADGQFRQHPRDYLEALERVLRTLLDGQDRSSVAAIALDTTGSTPCPTDADGTPLALLPGFEDDPDAMFCLWKDHTAVDEAARLNAVAAEWSEGDFRRFEGGIYSCEWFWSKLLHALRRNPRVRAAAAGWTEHCDWMTGVLAGRTAPTSLPRSRCAAGHKAMWAAEWGGLPSQEFLHAVDPLLDGWRDRLYRDTATADRPVGTIALEWAQKLGLPATVVIGGSALDCHFGAVGTGIRPGLLVKVIGTSTCDLLVAPRLDRCIRGICGQVDGSILPGLIGLEAGQSAFGDVYAWFQRLLGWAGDASLQRLEAEAAAIPPGANGVTALDWFNGRRSPDENPALTGTIAGLRLGTTAPMLYRALVEATACGARAIIDRFAEEGIPVRAVAAVGGISRKSPLVMQTLADTLAVPIQVAASDQACALGAAMVAATAAGDFPTLPHAQQRLASRFDRVFPPRPELADAYRAIYQRYQSLARTITR
jgi:L-ribulokinase